MSTLLIHQLYAAFAPWLILSFLLLGRNPHLSQTRIIVSPLLALGLLLIPIAGWNGFAWSRDIEMNPSFTLTALLSIGLCKRIGGLSLLRSCDWKTACTFGSIAAIVLYPLGLGLTPFDSYPWGWEPLLPVITALIASALLLQGNRFGIILLLPLGGFFLHLQESHNFWDALVDPIYTGFALIAMIFMTTRAGIARFTSRQTPQSALPQS